MQLLDLHQEGPAFCIPGAEGFRAARREDNLKEYLFNKHAIRHQLCVDCGVEVFARGRKPDGSEVVALNVSCIDGIELSKLTMTPVDGRNRCNGTQPSVVMAGLVPAIHGFVVAMKDVDAPGASSVRALRAPGRA